MSSDLSIDLEALQHQLAAAANNRQVARAAFATAIGAFVDDSRVMRKGYTPELIAAMIAPMMSGATRHRTADWLQGDIDGAYACLPSRSTLYRRTAHVNEGNAWYPVALVAIQVLQIIARKLGPMARLIWALDERIIDYTGATWLTQPGKRTGQIGQIAVLTKEAQKAAKDRAKLPTAYDPFRSPDVGYEELVLSVGFEGHPERFVIATLPVTAMADSQCVTWVTPILNQVNGALQRPWAFVADARWGDEASMAAAEAAGAGEVVVRTEMSGKLMINPTRAGRKTRREKEEGARQWNRNESAHRLFRTAWEYPGRPGHFFAADTRFLNKKTDVKRTVVYHYYPARKAPALAPGEELVLGVHVKVRAVATTLPPTKEGALRALALYQARWDLSETGIKELRKHELRGGGANLAPRVLATAVSLIALLIGTLLLFFQRVRTGRGELAAAVHSLMTQVLSGLQVLVEACWQRLPPS